MPAAHPHRTAGITTGRAIGEVAWVCAPMLTAFLRCLDFFFSSRHGSRSFSFTLLCSLYIDRLELAG